MRGSTKKEPIIKAGNVQSDINVTPLVDVCLVLLIIFMVITPLLQKGVDVALPETTKPEKIPENEKQLVIAVKLDGSVFIGQNWVPKGQLEAELDEGSWITERAVASDVFTEDPDALWAEVLRRKGPEYRLMSTMPFDPDLN